MEKETDTGYERTKRVDGQLVHERYDRRAKSGEVGVLVANRFSVTVEGSGVDAAALTDALKSIDLSSLAAMTTAQARSSVPQPSALAEQQFRDLCETRARCRPR